MPLLQINREKLEADNQMPNHLHKTRGLVKHLLGLMALPQQRAWRSRSYKVGATPSRGTRCGIGQILRAYEMATNLRSAGPQIRSGLGSVFPYPASLEC